MDYQSGNQTGNQPQINRPQEPWIPANRDNRAVGSNIMQSMNPETPKAPEIPKTPEAIPRAAVPETPHFEAPHPFGEVVNLDMPPMQPVPVPEAPETPETSQSTANATTSPAPANINHQAIRTTGDRLSEATVTEIDSLTNKLNQDGNMASFYDDIRDAMESNLDNSYNRKLGA